MIRAPDANWAIRFIRHFAECALVEIERRVADNETERSHKRLYELIRAAGPQGITKSELIRRTQFLDKRQRDEILASLVEGGLASAVARTTGTKPSLIYQILEGGLS